MNENQQRVWHYLKANGSQSIEQLYAVSGKSYYRNWRKHFEYFLKRMIDAGYIFKARKDMYRAHLEPRKRVKRYEVTDCQISIF